MQRAKGVALTMTKTFHQRKKHRKQKDFRYGTFSPHSEIL